MISRVRKGREHNSVERLGWQQKFTISQQGVEGILEEGEGGEIPVVEALVGGAKKSQRTVSGVASQLTGVESALKRTMCVLGVVEWDKLSKHATTRLMGHQEEQNQVFRGAEVEVLVLLQEDKVDMGDMGRAWMWRNRDMLRC